MRRNVQGQQTKTRSIQRSVQVLLTVSGIVFLLAGLVLAASGASVSGAIGSVTDQVTNTDQPADADIDSSDGDGTEAGSENETDSTSGDSGDGGDGASTDDGESSDSDDDGGDTDGSTSDADTDGDDSDGGDGTSSDGDDGSHTLTVTVEDQDGNTIEGANVSHNESVSDGKTTGGGGAVEWEVGDGTYNVSANADGYQSADDSIEIDGGDKSLTLTLEEEADNSSDGDSTVTFAIQDQSGDPIDNATVGLERETLGSLQEKEEKTVDRNGEVDFERENGEYSFTVTVDGNESEERTIEVDGDMKRTVTYETTDG